VPWLHSLHCTYFYHTNPGFSELPVGSAAIDAFITVISTRLKDMSLSLVKYSDQLSSQETDIYASTFRFSIAEGYADNELWEMEDCLITQD
jgi:hypothetical protein